jgi:thiamine pyrophosphate-dependent acetolactate synthase large subunit-like protein
LAKLSSGAAAHGQQTPGVGLPCSIAANLVPSGEKVMSISGDGSFLFMEIVHPNVLN